MDTVTSYIQFCEETIKQTKTVGIFLKNKPSICKALKSVLIEKKMAFLNGDTASVGMLNKEVRSKAKLAKLEYKNKVERKLVNGNANDVWKGLNSMMDRNQQKQPLVSNNLSAFECSE